MDSRCEFHRSSGPFSANSVGVAISSMQILTKLVLMLILPREIEDRDAHTVDAAKVPGVEWYNFSYDVF